MNFEADLLRELRMTRQALESIAKSLDKIEKRDRRSHVVVEQEPWTVDELLNAHEKAKENDAEK